MDSFKVSLVLEVNAESQETALRIIGDLIEACDEFEVKSMKIDDIFESWLQNEYEAQHRIVSGNINNCKDSLERLEMRKQNGGYLNDLGELQAAGPMLDASIAKLATLKSVLENYREIKERSE